MKATIYEYNNAFKDIDFGEKEIKYILVVVLSGDEVVYVYYSDGTGKVFDSSYTRFESNLDGHYVLSGEDIKKWAEWTPPKKIGAYEEIACIRLREFDTISWEE